MAGNPSVAARAAAYGMPGIEVDGNDVLAVRKPRPARPSQRARAGEGPTLIECKTYRTRAARRGHGRLHLPHARGSGGVEGPLPDRAAAGSTCSISGIASETNWRPSSRKSPRSPKPRIEFAEKSA